MSGVLLSGEGVASSSAGARVEVTDGNVRVIDGPFAEAKELIAGFAILEVDSLAEAVEHARKFALLVGTERVDVRRVVEFEDLGRTAVGRPRQRPTRRAETHGRPTTRSTSRLATLWRVESPRVIARLVRLVGDLDTAEELAQDAFVAAIEKWRQDGVPGQPGGLAEHDRAVPGRRPDPPPRHPARQVPAGGRVARRRRLEHDLDEIVDGDLADDLLGLIFMSCHPILSPDARSALTLKLVCGLSTDDVARAFLTPAPTIAQRIVRAKRTLAAAKVRFELPGRSRSGRPGSTPSARSSTWSSTRATPPPAASSGSAATCARRRSGSAGCWPRSPRTTPRRWACSP